MTVTAIVVSHANEWGLRAMLDNLLTQTRKPDEIIVLYSDTPNVETVERDYPEVFLFARMPDMKDWGHSKRAAGIGLARCEWVGFFNDDDSYDGTYLGRMLAAGGEADAVYCAWNEQPRCEFRCFQSTAGNFIVRTELARRVGWLGRHYEADGAFIDALVAEGARVARVDDTLYFHNVQ